MKTILTVLFFSTLAHAGDYGGLGQYDGMLFTGAGLHSPLTIQSGDYNRCETVSSDMVRCDVDNGRIEVLTRRGTETFTLKRVLILKSKSVATETTPSVPVEHHYFRATRPLTYGSHTIEQNASITMNWYSSKADRVFGYIELSDLGTKSAFEAYRN